MEDIRRLCFIPIRCPHLFFVLNLHIVRTETVRGERNMGYHSIRLRLRSVVGFACLLMVAVVGGILLTGQEELAIPTFGLFHRGPDGSTEEARVAFLTENGWEAELPAVAEQEITVPAEFDETYEQYNAIQQAQGFDLQKYAGKCATEYTYHILNYPENGDVVAHLLVYKDKIVGADLSAMEQGGFVEPVKRAQEDG